MFTVAEFTGVVLVASLLAGFVGSLTGLGGGIIVTPVLTIFLGVDIRYAIGASLIVVSLLFDFNLSALLMEVFWVLISFVGIYRYFRLKVLRSETLDG